MVIPLSLPYEAVGRRENGVDIRLHETKLTGRVTAKNHYVEVSTICAFLYFNFSKCLLLFRPMSLMNLSFELFSNLSADSCDSPIGLFIIC